MLLLHAASILFAGLLPVSKTQEVKRVCQNGCCTEVSVLQQHTRPYFGRGGDREPDWQFDEIVVEFKACAQVAHMQFRLPERQQCEGASTKDIGKCEGYSFRQTSDGGCFLKRTRSRETLPTNKEVKEFDIVGTGRLSSCRVDNNIGDGVLATPTPKRSTADLELQALGSQNTTPPWQFFTILVRNPARTPLGKDVLGNAANSFQMVLKADNGTVLASIAYPARDIKTAWYCSYSDWVLTSPCTAKCGGGIRYKVRRRLHAPPEDYDRSLLVSCDEPLSTSETCNQIDCNSDCELGDWVRWADGPCTASCGGGLEVQRRRIIAAPRGNGRSKEGVRVRYESCNVKACEPRCQQSTQSVSGNKSFWVETPCSQPCNGGVRSSMLPAQRKDIGMPDAKCASVRSSQCSTETCKTLNLFPGKPGSLPWAGGWYDLSVVFLLSDLADVLELRPPRGFDLGTGKCKLIEHNLPRLKSCMTMNLGEQKQLVTFDFFNPLEAHREEGGSVMYKVRIWVKHPTDCSAGIDPEGTCRAKEGEREWTLTIRTYSPVIWETSSASYEFYQPGAVPNLSRKVRSLDLNKVSVTEPPKDKATFKSQEE